MALVGSAILGAFSHSAAEKAFRPLWDAVEDHVVYTLVALAIIVAPSSMFFASTLACNLVMDYPDVDGATKYNLQYVNRYCAQFAIPGIVLYFPHLLLLIGTVLVIVDRPFVLILFKSYNVEQMFKVLVLNDPYSKNMDKHKEGQEVVSCLFHCSRYYGAYLWRIFLSLAVSVLPLVFLVMSMVGGQFDRAVFSCDPSNADDYWDRRNFWYPTYSCTGHPVEFYWVVALLVTSLLSIYFLLNVWNLVWILIPSLNSLHRVMHKFKAISSSSDLLNQLYYNNRDVKLLLGLLSSSSGIAVPLRSLALVDPNLNSALLPTLQGVDEYIDESRGPAVRLRFSASPLLRHIAQMKRYKITFLLEHQQVSGVFNSIDSEIVLNVPGQRGAMGPVTVNTLIGGKIVVSRPISTEYRKKP